MPPAPSWDWTTVGPPPAAAPDDPVIESLAAGTVLHRVHRGHAAEAFNPTPSRSLLTGGRFDTPTGDPAYTYAGCDEHAAIAETICRDLPPAGRTRMVPFVRLRGRTLSTIEVTRTLHLLVLHGAALTKVGATLALTKSDADQYLRTRAWAETLLHWFPDIDGFSYRCRHDEDRVAVVLFAGPKARPRAAGALRALPDGIPLDSGAGLTRAREVLAAHNAAVEPPRD